MTSTEKLIAEAREILTKWNDTSYSFFSFVGDARYLIPTLCDALEQAQATLEQTWEWDMYKAAQKEIERLRKELAALASESVKRDIALAKLEAEVMAAIEAQNAQRWIPVTERLPNEEDGLVNGNPRENITLHNAYMLAEHNVAKGWIVSEYPEWEDAQVTHWQPLPQPPKGED